jgi:hypothetical protein
VFDSPLNPSASRDSLLSVGAICAASAIACVALIACDAAAEHHREAMGLMSPPPAAVAHVTRETRAAVPPAPASAAPSSNGAAALHEYRDDLDPSHAAVASYRD